MALQTQPIYLSSLYLKGRLAGETLEDDGAQRPKVRLGVVLQRHYHFRGLHTIVWLDLGTHLLRFTTGLLRVTSALRFEEFPYQFQKTQ
jgi:hypothetical protein